MESLTAEKLSLVMPVFNEQDTLLECIHSVLRQEFVGQLVIVDDASTDDSWDILQGLTDPRVLVIRHARNQGKGAALRTGLGATTCGIIGIQDADLEYDPAEFEQLLKPILVGRADVVYGSRFNSGQTHNVLLFWHSVGNRILTLASNAMTNINLTDMETCYKVFTREVLDALLVEEDRFGFEPEFTVKVAKRGFRIYEMGISYNGRTYDEGKKIGWRDGVEAFQCVVKYSVRETRRRKRSAKLSETNAIKSLDTSVDEMSQSENYYDWIADLIQTATQGNILELGAGNGTFTKVLSKYAKHVDAVEPSKELVVKLNETAANIQNVRVIEGTMESSLSKLHAPYDGAVLINVLEHIENDRQVLQCLKSRIKPGGRIAIWVPAHELLYSKFDLEVGHYRRYSRRELRALASHAGLQVVTLKHVNALGALAWGVIATMARQHPTSSERVAFWDKHVVPRIRRLEETTEPLWGQSLLLIVEIPSVDHVADDTSGLDRPAGP